MDTKTKKQREDDLRKSLNSAYLKAGASQEAIDKFKIQANKLLDSIEENKKEEFYKTNLVYFLNEIYYKDKHYINVKDSNDLVIHNDKKSISSVGVIIEVKRPSNKPEMVSCDNLNKKSLQELVLYYLRERVTHKNLHIKHLIVTNINEWFIFDARIFERCFAENKQLVKDFHDFESGRLAGHKTSSFYEDIAKPVIELCKEQLTFTYFNLAGYQTLLENTDKENDKELIPLFKALSPEHLLKLSFSNDANSLNQEFYNELLHIIGLEEIKEGGKKLIKRKEKERHSASFLEQTICNIKNRGEITQEQPLFDAAIALCIIWINRILFLKLLEAQLMTYHKNNKLYQFFNIEKLTCFSDLNHLFFSVLAIKEESRDEDSKKRLCHIPYLNSSLFEEKVLESKTLDISKLRRLALPILSTTVLKNEQGHKLTGELDVLSYLFSFLDAYDFSNDSKEDIKENNKSLITASVLGLIFEKINGYKDGSFFTPSIITMYMSRETIRLAVLQKFNELKELECQTFDDLKSTIKINNKENRKEANDIVNSIKVCDPAVGSGHFLVSVLNEFIAIKSELGILVYHDDDNYTGLSGWKITVENDELEITRNDNDTIKFEYHLDSKDSQRIQKTLFHEKQKIIENCLFGVDINSNSVEICRLRLWIELLKNAYYKEDGKLETLPNIDINIKIGNSLISRFPLDADLKSALQRSNTNIEKYKEAFHSYQNAKSKSEKKEMDDLIKSIKDNFHAEAYENDPNKKLLSEKIAAKHTLTNISLIEKTEKEKLAEEKAIQKIENEIARLSSEVEKFRNNSLYENAFEWRFEFPEALNDDGDFIGFDVIIGNPPYINAIELDKELRFYLNNAKKYNTLYQKWDVYIAFIEQSLYLSNNGIICMIIPYPFLNQAYAKKIREFIFNKTEIIELSDLSGVKVFEKAVVTNCIFLIKNSLPNNDNFFLSKINDNKFSVVDTIYKNSLINDEKNFVWDLSNKQPLNFNSNRFKNLGDYCFISIGMVLNADEKKAHGLFIKEDLLSDIKTEINCKKYTEAKHIEKYKIGKILYLEWGTERVPSLIRRETFPDLYKHPKLLVSKIGKIKATFDKSNIYCDQTIRICMLWHDLKGVENKSITNSIKKFQINSRTVLEGNSTQVDLKFLLAILNSELSNYLLNQIRGIGNIDINPDYLKNIPIPLSTSEQQQPFIQLVDKILKAKKTGQDTRDLEAQIDRLVYALYGLSEAEIAIVEGKE